MIEHLIEPSWREALSHEWAQPYFKNIEELLARASASGELTYPAPALIFNAFNRTPLNQVKVVVLGQDPYHQPNQAMGLSFSVPNGVKVPASLRNVYKELVRTVENFEVPDHGDLTAWAEQGVLMLNAALTVAHNQAGSHAKIGWQTFTDAVIKKVSAQCDGVVFLLWGNFAHKKAELIDASKHHILTAVHPSPLARGGFSGSNHFVLANQYLQGQGKAVIDWQV